MNQITPNHEQFLVADRPVNAKLQRPLVHQPRSMKRFFGTAFWFFLVVVLPVLSLGIYLFGFASDQYVSEARFIIHSPEPSSSSNNSFYGLLKSSTIAKTDEQVNAVIEYISSRDALATLQKRLDISALYGRPDVDIISQYPGFLQRDDFESLYDYYSTKVVAEVSTETNITHLAVKAFTPEDAQKIANEILVISEEFVNRLNERAHDKAVEEASQRVDFAVERLRKAQLALDAFRNSQAIIDPKQQSSGGLELIGQLDASVASVQSQLDQMRQATPGNPAIQVLEDRLSALHKEIGLQTAKLVGNDAAMANKIGEYESLTLEAKLAAKLLETTSKSLAMARAEADSQQFYLQRVVEPNRPDFARYPQRIKLLLIVAAGCLMSFLILWMLVIGVLEHAPKD